MSDLLKVFVLMVLTSCSPPSEYEQLQSFYYANKEGDFNRFEYVLLINEIGDCISCNNAFSKSMSNSINDDKVLFIVSGSGLKVDISPYIHENEDNVIWDIEGKFNKLGISEKCAILELGKNQIVQKTEISLNNIDSVTQDFYNK